MILDRAAAAATGTLRRCWKWLVAALIIAALAWAVDWEGSLRLLRRVEPGLLLAAALLDIACILVSAWKWQLLLEAFAIRIPLFALFRAYWIGAFVGSFLPSTVGGDVVRMAMVRDAGGTEHAAASVIVDRLTGFAVLLAITLVAVLWRPEVVAHGPFGGFLVLGIAGGCAGLLLAILLLLRPRRPRRPTPRGGILGKALALLARLEGALADYARQGRALLTACAISLLFNLLIALFQYAIISALGFEVAFLDVLVIAPLVTLISALPLSPNGLGVAEGIFVLLYAQAGLTPEQALAAALLRRALLTVNSLAGGSLWLLPGGGAAAKP